MTIFCRVCEKETDHVDQGNDIRPDRRYYCSVCRNTNPKPMPGDGSSQQNKNVDKKRPAGN